VPDWSASSGITMFKIIEVIALIWGAALQKSLVI
jgi:hypothetical protein